MKFKYLIWILGLFLLVNNVHADNWVLQSPGPSNFSSVMNQSFLYLFNNSLMTYYADFCGNGGTTYTRLAGGCSDPSITANNTYVNNSFVLTNKFLLLTTYGVTTNTTIRFSPNMTSASARALPQRILGLVDLYGMNTSSASNGTNISIVKLNATGGRTTLGMYNSPKAVKSNILIDTTLEANGSLEFIVFSPTDANSRPALKLDLTSQDNLTSAGIYLNIFDAVTQQKITENITILITKDIVSTSNTVTGELLKVGLSEGLNEIKLISTNYSEARYVLNLTSGNITSLGAYLFSKGDINNVTFTFYDVNGALIENVFIEQFVITNTSQVSTTSGYSSIVGKVYFSYDPDYYYIYNCSHPNYICSSFVLNPPREDNYDITLTPFSASVSYSTLNITGVSTWNNITDVLSFNYSSGESGIANYKFFVYVNKSLACYNVSALTSNSYTCNLTGYDGTATVYGTADNRIFYGTQFELDKARLSDNIDIQDAALFSGAIALILIIIGATVNIFIALIFGVLALIVVFWLGIFGTLSLIMITLAVVVSVVIGIIVRRRY